MGRKKANLQLIENDKARKVSYTKRVKGIVKKTQELSEMCEVDACCVIYGPDNQAPVIWPSCKEEARRILTNFKQKPENNLAQKQVDQDVILKEKVMKAKEELLKIRRRNRKMQMENIITEIIHGRMTIEQVHPSDLGELLLVLDDNTKGIQQMLSKCKLAPSMVANNDEDTIGNKHEDGDLEDGASTSNSEDDYGLCSAVKKNLTIGQTPSLTQMYTGSPN